MGQGTLRFRAVALTAAYAVALHTLLASFVSPAFAFDPAVPVAAFCAGQGAHGTGDQPTRHPDDRSTCALACTMAGCGMAGGESPRLDFELVALRAGPVRPPKVASLPPPAAAVGPHAARAPPLA